jgi:23S rRNA pseudouridine2605 synthase
MGLTILRLVRIRQGPIELGDLPSGGFRSLDRQEVQSLLEATGLSDSSGKNQGNNG